MRIFISRNLKNNSPFKVDLMKEGYSVTGISLLAFIPIPFDPIPKVDWLFFYSKNGVKYFFEQCSYPFDKKDTSIAAMGISTAKTIKNYGYQAAYIGNGTPMEIANDFGTKVKGQKIAFLRATSSKKSIQIRLKKGIEVIDRIVYRNIPITNCSLPPFQVLVFTSPANAQTYFKYNTFCATQHIFSIGGTTTSMLHELGIRDIITAPNPTEIALVKIILSHLKKNS